MDDTIFSEKIQIERKVFFFDMKENDRGVLVRITEDVRGRRDTIIVPASGLREFRESIDNMIEVMEDEGLFDDEEEFDESEEAAADPEEAVESEDDENS